jgi:predicted nucleic acid-binding protein
VGVLIDASVLIGAERARIEWDELLGRGAELDEDEAVALAAITASELLHGVHRLKGVPQARAALFVETVLDHMPIQAFDAGVARVHAMLSAELAGRGAAVGAHDLILAATAVALGYDIATRDLRSFPRIPGLGVRRW